MTAAETIRQAAGDWLAEADIERRQAWACAKRGDLAGAVEHAKLADSFERLSKLVAGVYGPTEGTS